MAQAHVDLVKSQDITIVEDTPSKVVCRLGLAQEVIIKKVKGELKICLK